MGLVAWYKLDGDMNDSSKYKNDGSTTGVSTVTGKIGQALQFGPSDNATASHIDSYDYNNHTVSFWIYLDTALISSYITILEVGNGGVADDGTGGRLPKIYFLSTGNGSLHWRWSTDVEGNDGLNTPAGTVTQGEWIHLCGVKYGSRYDIYKNGDYLDGVDLTSDGVGSGKGGITLRESDSDNVTYTLDDVRIYDHALSPKEVKLLSQAKIAHFHLYTDAKDCSGYENDGTLYNSPSFTTEDNFNCLQLSTTSQYLSFPQMYLDHVSGGSLVWWMKKDDTTRHYIFNISTTSIYNHINIDTNIEGELDTNNIYFGGGTTFDPTVWHMYVVTLGNNGDVKGYVDDNEVFSNTGKTDGLRLDSLAYQFTSGYWDSFTGYAKDIQFYMTELSSDDVSDLYHARASLDGDGNLYANEFIINGVGESQNLVRYEELPQETLSGNTTYNYSNGNKTYIGRSDSSFSMTIGQYTNPNLDDDLMVKLENTSDRYDSTHRINVYHYFPSDKNNTYRITQWIYVHADTENLQRNYFGFEHDKVCTVNTTTVDTNPYFIHYQYNDSKYLDKWVLQVYYIYPYGSTGNDNNNCGIYETDGTFTHLGNNRNWADVDEEVFLRQFYMYQNGGGTLYDGTYSIVYRPRIDLVDGQEPSIDELLTFGEHLPLSDGFDINGPISSGIYKNQGLSELGPINGLIGYWPLDGNAKDYSGEGNDGSITGLSTVQGIRDQALEITATGQYVDLPDDVGYESQVSVFAWVKINGSPFLSSFHIICGGSSLEISIWTTGPTLRCGLEADSRYFDDSTQTDLDDGNWHHVGFTYANGTKIMYYDGDSVHTNSSITGTLDNILNRRLFRFGSSTNYYGNITIDEYRIYNRALTASEVKILYQMTNPESDQAMIQTPNNLYIKKSLTEV